jgi:RNA polymerase sigma-70 factor (ECF subfamily)
MMEPLKKLNDLELLALLRDGDHAAFTEIYDRYFAPLYSAAYSLLKDADTCDDIVQEIFTWLWGHRDRHLTDSLKPYLRAAVKYQVAKMIRHGKVHETFYQRTVAAYQPDPAADKNLEIRELEAIMAAFTASLPEKAREVFRLSREEHLTNKQIASQLGISEKTVEAQMTINLRKLKLNLGKYSFWSILL